MVSKNGGLQVFNHLWDRYNISGIIDDLLPKHSGDPPSAIIKNLSIGKVLGYHSLTELCSESSKEIFLSCNTRIDRTNYSKNMNKINHNKQNTILMRTAENVFMGFGSHARNDAMIITDGSVLPVEGETFKCACWVYDSRTKSLVWGYEVLTHIINIGKHNIPVNFRINDLSKERIIELYEAVRKKFGINLLAYDGGFRGMDFFKQLDKRRFKFYTKATMNWKWDFHGFIRTTEELSEQAKKKFKRNHKYADYIVEKMIDEGEHKGEIMKLRLVFVKGDDRVFLTNDFESHPKKIYGYYKRRWEIETTFREEKQNLGFENLTVRKTNAIRTHIMTVFLAFILCRTIMRKIPGINGIRILIREVIRNAAEIIETAKGIIVRFLYHFRYRSILEEIT